MTVFNEVHNSHLKKMVTKIGNVEVTINEEKKDK
tara:strand:+ start:854 stop:955 length:102 start_codon:yes stop_codon:yes gene_type:complete